MEAIKEGDSPVASIRRIEQQFLRCATRNHEKWQLKLGSNALATPTPGFAEEERPYEAASCRRIFCIVLPFASSSISLSR